jgi:RNA polymerase sigma-70 factor (ECF subfamily)
MLGSDDLAWDALQEALWCLARKPEQPANLAAWLARTTANRSLHLQRMQSRRRRHEQEAATHRLETTRRDDPYRLCLQLELQRQLEAALDRLPDEQRAVFILRELERLDYEAIAARLNAPVGTVRSRLHRARAALRVLVGEAAGPAN